MESADNSNVYPARLPLGNCSTSRFVEHVETPSSSSSQDAVLDLSTRIRKVDDIKTENLSSPGRMKTTSPSSSSFRAFHPYHKQDDAKAENFPVNNRHSENPFLPLRSTSQDDIKIEGFAGVQYARLRAPHQPVFNEQAVIKPEYFPVADAAYSYPSHCAPTQTVYSGTYYSQPASFIPSPIIVPTTRASVITPSTVTAERAVAPVPATPIHSPQVTSQNLSKPYITNNFYPPAPIPHIPTVPSHSPEGPRGSIVGTSTAPAMPPALSNVLTKIMSSSMMLNQLLAQNSLADISIREPKVIGHGKGGRPFKEVAVDSGLPEEEERLYEEFRKRVKMHVADEHKGQKSQKGAKHSLSPEPSTSRDSPDSKQPCPDGKSEAYWMKRRKNNEAAKRSRDARRAKEDELAIRVEFLIRRIQQLLAILYAYHLSTEQWMEDVRCEVNRQCPGVNIQLPKNCPFPPNIYGVPGHMPF